MRSIRLLLLILMMACLPLTGWADTFAHAVTSPAEAAGAPAPTAGSTDLDDAAAKVAQPPPFSETTEPQLQPGADLAEQLLPAPSPRLTAWSGRAGPPRYAGAPLPEPDLPLLPRPPRA
ncbi:hypothetical protein PO002_18915 [Cupriavidus necator]|uniref:hypothetical protein n=1 Tax=Cupriavidus necator TaxID=106590 RepID=UPI0039C0C808